MADSTVNQIKALARTALKDRDPNQRTEAILALRHHDHPQIMPLLERIIAHDDNPGVRDLARNVLKKKRIQAGIPTDLPIAGADFSGSSGSTSRHRQSGAWACATCGGDNNNGDTTCQYCGTPNVAQAAAPAPDNDYRGPTSAEQTEINRILREKVYLLHKDNKDFLKGKRDMPVGVGGEAGGLGCMMVFVGLFCLIGIGIIALTIHTYLNYQALEERGIVTSGQYYDRHISTDSEDGDSYYVHFAFVTSDGREIRREQSVSRDEYNRTEPGMAMQVMYDPQNPSNAVINGTNNAIEHVFLAFFSVFWNLISWTVLFAFFFSRRRANKLARYGKVLPGSVTGARGYFDSDNDYMVEIRYVVQTPEGATVESRYKRMRDDLRERALPPPGMPLAVLYLRPDHMELL